MNLKEEILHEHSKAQVMRIVAYIGADAERFDEAMKLFLEGDYRVTQRIFWVVSLLRYFIISPNGFPLRQFFAFVVQHFM